ncbi:MAG: L,D-transpeptidase [Bauldia sp.]|nr:L,D-transpeptidase [Bauldia sp.]
MTFQIAGKSSVRFAIALLGLVAVVGLGAPADAGLFKKKPPPVDYVDQDFENLPPIKGENQLAKNLRRTPVYYRSPYPAGTIIVDTSDRYLYLLVGEGRAIRYGVAVGRDGFTWEGSMKVSKKTEWPDWRPPADMIARAKKEGKTLPPVVKGGPGNPLGARALYLGNSEYRIHGTNAPKSIGHNSSSGCIRMLNEHVIDLYDKVPIGTRVIVIA